MSISDMYVLCSRMRRPIMQASQMDMDSILMEE